MKEYKKRFVPKKDEPVQYSRLMNLIDQVNIIGRMVLLYLGVILGVAATSIGTYIMFLGSMIGLAPFAFGFPLLAYCLIKLKY